MKTFRFALASSILVAAGWAHAAPVVVYDTSLPVIAGSYGSGIATTSTDASGRVTTVAGPSGGGNRASAAPSTAWAQENVGGGATVGITTDYARSGNGSAYLSTLDDAGKADLSIYFQTPFALSSITGLSYDWYRDASSTTADHLHSSLRLLVRGLHADKTVNGYLVYERVYNGAGPFPENSWQSEDIADSMFWGTGSLPGAFSVYSRTLADWSALVSGLNVYGMQFGVGSGWSGRYTGAVDNVTLGLADGTSTTWNFEVQAAEVPEPGTLALAAASLLSLAALRRRRS